MELEGSLRAFSIPEILQFLGQGQMTGVLMVRSDGKGVDLIIREGRIVNSTNLNQTRRLGQMLVWARLIHRSDLEEILREQSTTHPDRMIGQLLVEHDLITSDALREAIRLQLEEEVWELISWESGEFRFEHRAEIELMNVLVELEIQPLIIKGTARIDEWRTIIHNLKGNTGVPVFAPWNPEERANLKLTPFEWHVLSFVNGFFNIGSIALRTGLGKFETYSSLNSLLLKEIISLKDPDAVASSESAGTDKGQKEAETQRLSPGARQGFFGKRRAEATPEFQRGEKFATSVGLVARFLNLTLRTCFEQLDQKPVGGENQFLARAWYSVVMECPMADLIRTEGKNIEVRPLEAYLEMGGIASPTLRVYEDAIEGLGKLYSMLAGTFQKRLGAKTFRRIVQTLVDEWLPTVEVEKRQRFDLREFLSRWAVREEGEQ